MSIVIKTRRAKPKTWSTSIMWLVFGLAAIFFLVIYGQQLLLEHDLKERIAVQRSENAALDDFNTRLKSNLLYYQSDKYIEQRAREDLNLRRADEEVLIPIKEEVGTPRGAGESATGGKTTPDPVQNNNGEQSAQERPVWQAWLLLFSPPSSSH